MPSTSLSVIPAFANPSQVRGIWPAADGSGKWRFDVPANGRERSIVRRGAAWQEKSSAWVEAGPYTVDAPGADAVELLVDRRQRLP